MFKLMDEVAARCPGGTIPRSYAVFDTETTGTDPAKDRILQYGFGIVEDGELKDSFSLLLRHGEGVFIDPRASAVHGITHAKMAAEGMDPQTAFDEVLGFFEDYRRAGRMFVGHNMLAFDAKLFENEARRFGSRFGFGENEIVDTGVIVKAAQLGCYFDPRDSLRSWAYKVGNIRAKGIYWSLDRYCFEHFNLAAFGISREGAHDAGYDCLMTHYVLRRLREEWERSKASGDEKRIA